MSAPTPREALLEKVIDYFAVNGVGDTSLRTLAARIGTSHRMLIYHFGSRDGLLAALIDVMCRRQLEGLERCLEAEAGGDPRQAAWGVWQQIAENVEFFAPVFFELSAHAMVGHEWAGQLNELLTESTSSLAHYFAMLGHAPEQARMLANAALYISRGAAFDLAITGDRSTADAVIRSFLDWALVPEQA